jgi:hypothetical protein
MQNCTLQHKQAVYRKYTELLRRASEMATDWNKLSAEHRERFIRAILVRVAIHPGELEILIRKSILIRVLAT